jgi:hypothetical protein
MLVDMLKRYKCCCSLQLTMLPMPGSEVERILDRYFPRQIEVKSCRYDSLGDDAETSDGRNYAEIWRDEIIELIKGKK